MRKRLYAIAMTIVMLMGMLVLPAAAKPLDLRASAGSEASFVIYEGNPNSNITVTSTDGEVPGGMDFVQNGYKLLLEGSPEAAKIYKFTVHISDQCDDYITEENAEGVKTANVEVELLVDHPSTTDSTYTGLYTVGEEIGFTFTYSGSIYQVSVDSGKLPDGVKMTNDETSITIKGTAKKAGDYSFTILCFDEAFGGWHYQPVRIVIEAAAEPDKPEITKDPTPESTPEGGSVVFIAKADHAKEIIWHLESPNGQTTIEVKNAPNQFAGLRYSGNNAERLVLENLPLSLNGWKAKAKFVGSNGDAWSKTALITVVKAELKTPVIDTQPRGTTLEEGQTTVLSVYASSPDGNTLTYQWYMNDTNANSGGKAITGATASTYTPEYIEGTTYYYCAIRNKTGNDISAAVKTDAVAVTYTAKAPETEPETTATETTEPETSETPTEETILFNEPTVPEKPAKSGGSLIVVLAIVICIAVIGVCAVILTKLYFDKKRDSFNEDQE